MRTTLKEFQGFERGFALHRTRDMVVSQDDHTLYLLRWALLVSLVLIVLDVVVVAFMLSVFSSVFVPGS